MRFGFHFLDFTLPDGPASYAPALRSTAAAAEAAGASWFTVMDHYFQMEFFRTAHDPMLEAYATLGFLAGVTEKVKLGTVVTGVTYRHPGLLAKIGTTLDVLSGGRAFMGIGAAWYEREHKALGVPYPPLAERFERLEEALQIIRQMWSEDEGPFEGKHYQLAETINVPANLSRPHPPIVIGGSGEKKTLRLVAQYADATNLIVSGTEELAHKLDVLRRHCDDLGRDYDSIEKTVMGPQGDPLDDVDGFLRLAQEYADLGVQHIHLRAMAPDPAAAVTAFGERVAPRLAEIGG
ncbi:LLM class F420-dependent oxidoreductase [Phycicoccus sp. Root563]|uniref:LLM class F420-dependent oxidoreductase n=1 Tax=unclassified Phycicoccus TaxID=2637926 RepID=UPI0007026CBE|nr:MULTISPECIES: LLM class F420-dependent oxidoreductase [unclassified Phycicoccus]KQU70526.1 LLM class F420-dependent oxidoreductase [Phycicoccus sp. Root101]KQZ88818.1 LLM class F420-dependent oxidoreductase [Phycicoccus sp. Root563]